MVEKELNKIHFTYCDAFQFEVIKSGKKSLDDTYVYLQPGSLTGHEKKHRKRKFFRIVNVNLNKKGNYVIRQLRAISMEDFKTTLNDSEVPLKPITMSYSNSCELEIENGNTVRVDNIKVGDMWKYYWRHPYRDVRMAFIGILLSIAFGIMSTVISLISLL